MNKDIMNAQQIADEELMLVELEERFEFVAPSSGRCSDNGSNNGVKAN